MTRESPTSNPASDMDGTDDVNQSGPRATSAPARIVAGKRILPPGSSDKYPLPGRWPEPEEWLEPSEPSDWSEPEVELPPVVVEVAIEPTAAAAPAAAAPAVRRANWLQEPGYWLADHQVVPRPPTRPLPRPRRFVRMSRKRSTMLLLIAVVGIGVIGAGMVFAGHLTYEYFNTPLALPTTVPPTAIPTDTPVTATATDIPTPSATTDATSTPDATTPGATPNTTPDAPTVTP